MNRSVPPRFAFRFTAFAVAAGVCGFAAAGPPEAAPPAADPAWDRIAAFFSPPPEFAGDFGAYRSPLAFDDGRPVASAADWPRRRAEILARWHADMGPWPPVEEHPKVEYVAETRRGELTQYTVRFDLLPGVPTTGYLLVPPADPQAPQARRPAVLTVYYEPETAVGLKGENRDFALRLARRGFVTLSIGTDASPYYPSREAARLQPLSALAYAATTGRHVLADRSDVDPDRIGIVGHSYGGKWAMFASCLDDGFACAAWSDPGVVFDESRPNVNYWEPWYLGYAGPDFRPRGVPTATNPRTGLYARLVAESRDLHELHALMAPRPFLVSGGAEDPPERWKALNHAVAVNRLLGFEHRVGMTNRPTHAPTPESNGQIDAFFVHVLRPGPEPAAEAGR